MKQILVLSGKGGTGKTTIASALIKLSQSKAYADCDVDAPNLHLVTNQTNEPIISDYYGLKKAYINSEECMQCGLCAQYCKFDAIKREKIYLIDCYDCEGCGVCERICPVGAISMKDAKAGELMLYKNDAIFSTAELKMGSGTSGMLVSRVKSQMKNALKGDEEIIIIDGSPGIGCPVIASISGVDLVLIVAEPSISGISDMERIIKTARGFEVEIVVCINKYDVNQENTDRIIDYCKRENLDYLGAIPFDKRAIELVNQGKSIVDIDCNAGKAINLIYTKLLPLIKDAGVVKNES